MIVNQIDDLQEKYPSHPKTAYVKKNRWGKKVETPTKGKKAKKEKKPSKQPAYNLSKELQAVVGAESLSRPEVVKKMWEYIKANKCQDAKNKRKIVPDAKLEKVFGSKEPIDMMKMAGLLSKHFKK